MFLNTTIIQGPNVSLMAGCMRPLILVSIFIFLLNLPVQTMSFLKTWTHVQSHHHIGLIHSENHEHEHLHHHDHNDEVDSRPSPQTPTKPHCHEAELWGLFANPALGSPPVRAESLAFVVQAQAQFEVHELLCKVFCQSLLRPPIA
jgi:hypothetical protein